ncbi:M48 family metalloprotease [Catenulispora acidiphila]|uniref:hypothetical protein n=1 Tax=Catenulispora acidiphila TaxID=304895 RepID=UPI00117E7E22|nr:hypothetical protein [Catenulispora acidiphila]
MSAHRAARALLRVRAWVIAAYALSAAAACAALIGLARVRGWDGVGAGAVGAAAVVCVLWALPAIRLHRGALAPPKTVQLAGESAPELELLVRQLALQLQVPTPAGIELSPDCDAWLDPRPGGPVLVIGAPFLWWLRVSELRGLLAPLVAGMAAAGDERIVRARAFANRSIGALHGRPGRTPHVFPSLRRRLAGYFEARAEVLERVVAWEAVAASRMIEPAARAYAHEQINMAAAGWDRVLTRLAQPAWESGYCPVGLNVALVGALTSLGRRDRMAGSLATRLSERPACDLLEEPGDVDARASRMAAELFEGRRIERTVTWERYVTAVTEPELVRRAESVPDEHPVAKRIRTLISEAGVPGARQGGVSDGGTRSAVIPAPRVGEADGVPSGDVMEPDIDDFAAYLAVRLVEARLAAWGLDWLDGPVLRDRAGDPVPIHDMAASVADVGDVSRLSDWLARNLP